jgi:hypothetical protein
VQTGSLNTRNVIVPQGTEPTNVTGSMVMPLTEKMNMKKQPAVGKVILSILQAVS